MLPILPDSDLHTAVRQTLVRLVATDGSRSSINLLQLLDVELLQVLRHHHADKVSVKYMKRQIQADYPGYDIPCKRVRHAVQSFSVYSFCVSGAASNKASSLAADSSSDASDELCGGGGVSKYFDVGLAEDLVNLQWRHKDHPQFEALIPRGVVGNALQLQQSRAVKKTSRVTEQDGPAYH